MQSHLFPMKEPPRDAGSPFRRRILLALSCAAFLAIGSGTSAYAQSQYQTPSQTASADTIQNTDSGQSEEDLQTPPPERDELENIPKLNVMTDAGTGMPFDIRQDAIKEAALSYGARGGLAMRTFEIRRDLGQRGRYLDKVFDFRHLLIAAPSGLLIEPPIVSESENALLITTGGQDAAVADRYYHINENARIVSAPRTWNSYLERSWGEVTPPPDILRPENQQERDLWIENVKKGWEAGYAQADQIFEDDLARLTADYQGMVRYRMLLAQKMISPPYALQIDRGVTGGGDEMRVGDRAVKITGVPELVPGYEQWQPANR